MKPRLTLLWLFLPFAAVAACTTAEISAPSDAGSDGPAPGACAVGSSRYYSSPGCAAQPTCSSDQQDACAEAFCGCDGVTFYGGCGTASKPFVHLGACVADGGSPDASDASDSGSCGAGLALGYDAPGCSSAPVCVDMIVDACSAYFCGCDGHSFLAACGGTASRPYAHTGACADGDVDATADH